jgi:ring-1,2-phenylacetyl-CoA epoxidase subunit PaaB
MNDTVGLGPWEVFQQEKDGGPMRHGGSVMAPDADLAVHYAREFYGRRQESVRLWVVRRADIHDLADPDLLSPPMDRSFKKPGGYVMRDKLAAARKQSGEAKPKARSRGHDTTGRRAR